MNRQDEVDLDTLAERWTYSMSDDANSCDEVTKSKQRAKHCKRCLALLYGNCYAFDDDQK